MSTRLLLILTTMVLTAVDGRCRAEDVAAPVQTLAPCHPWGAAFTPMPISCQDFQFVALPEVQFATNRAELDNKAHVTLDVIARYIQADPSVRRVLVHGYTDETGTEPKNNVLADQRATAVRDYLVSRGVAADALVLQGYGQNRPTDEHWNATGRIRNRRVELYAIHWTNTLP